MAQLLAGVAASTEPSRPDQGRDKEVVKEVSAFTKKTGYSASTTAFVSVSGGKGDSVLEPSAVALVQGWKAAHKDGRASGTCCLKLWVRPATN